MKGLGALGKSPGELTCVVCGEEQGALLSGAMALGRTYHGDCGHDHSATSSHGGGECAQHGHSHGLGGFNDLNARALRRASFVILVAMCAQFVGVSARWPS